MQQREKTLLLVIMAVGGGAFGLKVLYPRWVAPMFRFDDEIARRGAELRDLEFEISKMEDAREKYRDYVYRTGGTDEKKVRDQFHSILNDLLSKCQLADRSADPKGSSPDKKTALMTLSYTIRAKGALQQAVLFLKNFYEVPHMARFRELKLVPEQAGRRGKPSDVVSLTGTIEVLVPPKFFGGIKDAEKNAVPRLIKYRPEEFASIWEKQPFLRPVKEVAKAPEPAPPPPPPPRPVEVWNGDPQRNEKVIRWCGAAPGEVMVVNTASNHREYVRVGHGLDGGELLMVHPYGALVRRKLESGAREYLYPLGALLAEAVALDEASGETQLRASARHFLAKAREQAPEPTPDAPAGVPGDRPGPPESLAGPLADMEGEQPGDRVSGLDPGVPGASTMTDRAGPPETLAGP
ncbi:MAG: hypothetical protein V2A79_03645, partial [Planctomycetota bacterium]